MKLASQRNDWRRKSSMETNVYKFEQRRESADEERSDDQHILVIAFFVY